MKASIQFRDDDKPLVRAKIPISILGLPFSSSIAAGDTKDLRFDLTTAFESGPSFRVSYRPNDTWNPFGLVVKTGIGAFGSPISAAMSMSAEFNLVGRGGPSFLLHFRPRIGDFCVKKTTSSSSSPAVRGIVVGHSEDSSESRIYSSGKINGFPMEIPYPSSKIDGLLSGLEVTAKSVLPVKGNAAVKFRWGVRIPPEFQTAFGPDGSSGRKHPAWISSRSLPMLVMSKISIEHVPAAGSKEEADGNGHGPVDAAKAWFSVGKQLEEMKAENGMLRKAVEEMRSELCRSMAGRTSRGLDGKGREVDEQSGGKGVVVGGKNGRRSGGGSSAAREEVNDELRKALMGGAGSSA